MKKRGQNKTAAQRKVTLEAELKNVEQQLFELETKYIGMP